MINDDDCMMDANSIASDDSGSDGDEGNASDDDLGIAMADTDLQDQNKRESDEFHQEVLTQDEIVRHMCDIIREVTNVIQIPATTARILLNHFKWDREKLMEAYYENSDPEKLFRDVHIVSPFRKSSTSSAASGGGGSGSASSSQPGCSTMAKSVASAANSYNTGSTGTGGYSAGGTGTAGPVTRSRLQNALQSVQPQSHPPQPVVVTVATISREETCQICFTPCLQEAMTGLQCEHKFCLMCWTQYLTTKIMDEGMGQTISCAAFNCDILVDDATVMRLVSDKKVRSRYQHLITNSFVECNRLLRWCPSPDCSNAIKVQYADSRPVTCKCGFTFCFTCGHEWHDPVKCSILRKWIKKCSDDSETSNWIAANTKECPKCHVTIEKDGGCNHMTCKSQACKWEFCWVCLGPWEPHGSTWYSCNRFDDANAKAARDAQERSRAALQRYLHYCNRYMNHMQSLKFENKLYASAKTKMEQMQQHNMSWIEVQFLRKAINVLCQCRRTLMYTYVFAYYLTKNNQSIIFEDNQQDLEIATEQLSEFLERDLEKENLATLKQKVQDKYRYCENRRKVLLDHCHEGDEKDWWIFSD